MTLKEDLLARVNKFATTPWGPIPNARVVPNPADLTFDNTGERMDVTVLYSDVHRSTEMVDTLTDTSAAEYYKAFLHCCAKLIQENGGVIEAYDGDRVMAIFTGEQQVDNAVKTAWMINHAVNQIINPAFLSAKLLFHRPLKHTVGIDCGQVLIAKTGARGEFNNDLVWVGPAANYAAKLNSFNGLDPDYPTRISDRAYAKLSANLKLRGEELFWNGPYTDMVKFGHYRSSYHWTFA
ncbi:MAG TPA: adenylate/guanylate cyclase domain-containing protein [Burkholderiaceae bacterium]|nr:adenylate/guanylate cyclase domain-containing protein [Burkholderiaceae bacterium]